MSKEEKDLFKNFSKTKDKAQSSFGTFGIPFGVSGPRPLQEARFFADQTVPAGFFFPHRDALSFVRPARFAGENDFKDAVTQPWFRFAPRWRACFQGSGVRERVWVASCLRECVEGFVVRLRACWRAHVEAFGVRVLVLGLPVLASLC